MPALYLCLTIALALSATARNSKLKRKDVAPVDTVDIFNRHLSLLPRSNTSDANSLNMNSKREEEKVQRCTVTSTIDEGLFTVNAQFQKVHVSRVVLDTSSSITWVLQNDALRPGVDPRTLLTQNFEFLGAKLEGYRLPDASVKLQHELLESFMDFVVVSKSEATRSYEGGIALRLTRTATSWPNKNEHELSPTFAFYYLDNKAEFDYGDIRKEYKNDIKWYNAKNGVLVDQALFKVNGKVVKKVAAFHPMINTGVPNIYANSPDVAMVYKQVKNSRLVKEYKGHTGDFWMVPCDEEPAISISLGKVDYAIAKFLLQDQSTEVKGKKYCQGVLQSHPSLPQNTISFGVSFILERYVAFDPNRGVGLFELKPPVSGNKKSNHWFR